MKQEFPVVVRPFDPVAPNGHRAVAVETWDNDVFTFASMERAEEFMALHDLVPVTMAEMATLRDALAAGDEEEHEE